MLHQQTIRHRFWAKVKRGNLSECWEWTAGKNAKGYGGFRVGGAMEQAHRMAWSLTSGPIPGGLCVLHKCDNPGCVNPRHLFLGTQADNIVDMKEKNRGTIGEQNPGAKLTFEQVKMIREEGARPGVTQTALAAAFSVSQPQISSIISGRCWKGSP